MTSFMESNKLDIIDFEMTFMRAREDGTVTQSAIDYLITNKPEQCQNPKKLECGFSDHDATCLEKPARTSARVYNTQQSIRTQNL